MDVQLVASRGSRLIRSLDCQSGVWAGSGAGLQYARVYPANSSYNLGNGAKNLFAWVPATAKWVEVHGCGSSFTVGSELIAWTSSARSCGKATVAPGTYSISAGDWWTVTAYWY
uniref:Uncharacterized protein n=1 Tax=Pseudomonas aeruginosa TaxID=287 RepID=A0A6H1QAT4_PSEAI|nr:Hypothetical protein [Pseudomonas aeruginosa]